MTLSIIIDTREGKSKLAHYVEGLLEVVPLPADLKYRPRVVTEALDLGDVVFRFEWGDSDVYERKTLGDLAASLKDKRFHSQKKRLKSVAATGVRVSILAEVPESERGFMDPRCTTSPSFLNTGIAASALRGALVHSEVRDGFGVLWSESTRDSAAKIVARAIAAARFEAEIQARLSGKSTTTSATSATSVTTTTTAAEHEAQHAATHSAEQLAITAHHKRKRDNATPQTRFADQLMSAEGVGPEAALAIAASFNSMADLVRELHEKVGPQFTTRSEPDEKACTKACARVFAGVAGVGPKRARAIYDALFG